MKKVVIVFSGFNLRAVIAFLRTLEENDVAYGIIAKSDKDEIFRTTYSTRVLAIRKQMALNLVDMIASIYSLQSQLGAEEYVIAPSTEALNRFLLDNRDEFEELGCEIPLVSQDMYEQISDKLSFTKLCEKNNILTPREYENIADAKSPFVAKPKTYYSKGGEVQAPILIFDQDQKETFTKNRESEDFYYQEFIDGKSYYLLYYFYEGGTVARFSQINYMQQPEGKSIIGAESSNFHETDESDKYEKLFRSIRFRGLVMCEVKCQNGKNYMIEANPRFWGPSQLFVDAGVNLFESFLYDWGLINEVSSSASAQKPTKYFWYGGIKSLGISDDEITFHAYDKVQYKESLSEWMSRDVYNRSDTRDLYELELGKNT